MIKHTIFIDESNFDFIDKESKEADIVSNVILSFDKQYRLQKGDKFCDLSSLQMYEDKCDERCIDDLRSLLKKYGKEFDGLYVSGFLIDDANAETLFTFVKVNFV